MTVAAFPPGPLGILVELFANGVWNDITQYVYQRNPIVITRGRQDESTTIGPSTLTLTLNNRDFRFSPLQDTGAYGRLGRNIPIRVSAPETGSAASALVYRFVGEISELPPAWDNTGKDIYADITASGVVRRLAQGNALNSPMYRFITGLTGDNTPVWYWPMEDTAGSQSLAPVLGGQPMSYTSGLSLAADAASFAGSDALPTLSNSKLSVNTGGNSGVTRTVQHVQWYRQDGTYTWNAMSGIASVKVEGWGSGAGGPGGFTSSGSKGNGGGGAGAYAKINAFVPTAGAAYTIVVGSGGAAGIVGSLGSDGHSTTFNSTTMVAAAGSASTLNGHGGLGGTVAASTGDVKHAGGAGGAASSTGGAGGGGAGGDLGTGGVGASSSTSAGARGGNAGGLGGTGGKGGQGKIHGWGGTGGPGGGGGGGAGGTFRTRGGFGADGAVRLSYSQTIALNNAAQAANSLKFLLSIPAAGEADGTVLASFTTNGWIALVQLVYGVPGNGTLEMRCFDITGTQQLVSAGSGPSINTLNGVPSVMSVSLLPAAAGKVTGRIRQLDLPASALNSPVSFLSQLTSAGAQVIGSVTGITINPNGTAVGTSIGHVVMQYGDEDITDWNNPALGFAGESAGSRVIRLCGEQNVEVEVPCVDPTDSELMGPQTSQTLLALLQECEDADRGLLYESLNVLGIGYRTRRSLSNQTAQATLDYSAAELSDLPQPTYDDEYIVNLAQVTRTSGGTVTASLDMGAVSTQNPPNGVGTYAKSFTVNCYTDSRLSDLAGWAVNVGTVDDLRYPTLTVDLSRSQMSGVFQSVVDADIGDYVNVTNQPSQLPPFDIRQIIYGVTETLTPFQWIIEWNCVPERPYETALCGDPVTGHADTDGSTLHATCTNSATSITVDTTNAGSPLWTTVAGDFPFDILIGTEQITVTNITGSSSPQTFTVTRHVNGVVEIHTAGDAVRLFNTPIIAL